jgi:hypothetical protein
MSKPVLLACLGALALATPAWGAEATPAYPFERTRIPHLDGSGRATVVEMDPTVPGAKEFLRGATPIIPRPGELVVAPRSTPEPSPSATSGPGPSLSGSAADEQHDRR